MNHFFVADSRMLFLLFASTLLLFDLRQAFIKGWWLVGLNGTKPLYEFGRNMGQFLADLYKLVALHGWNLKIRML